MIVFEVDDTWWKVGTADFLRAFFSTVAAHLEPEGWGSRFPVVMSPLYEGALQAKDAPTALKELREIRDQLKAYPPDVVVWDFDDRQAEPPWGSNISTDITDLSNYFVTSDGEDLIDVLQSALRECQDSGKPFLIRSV